MADIPNETETTQSEQRPTGPTRAQVYAAQMLLRRSKRGYGKDTPEIRKLANATPID